jgi:hypothetical protein
MFRIFGFSGVKCPRCEHKNDGESGYCSACGLTLGAPRNEPVLRDNRWIPAADELAVFFGVRELSGVFNKVLRVPAGARAYILQADKTTEVPQGEYEIEGFFTRLNNLLRDQYAEILITRAAPVTVEFSFDDLQTAEHLQVSGRFGISVRIERIAAFAQHFMTAPGTVTAQHVRELLAPSVRQVAAEFVGARSIRDMAGNEQLRAQLDERLQAIRAREVELYGRVVEAESRKLALERGAGATLTELEHELAQKGAARASETEQWQHVRTLAGIKMRSAQEVAQQLAREEIQLAQQAFTQRLRMQQIDNQIAQALTIEDEAYRRAQLVRLRQTQAEAAQREAQMEAEQHTARWQGAALENAARKREAERVQEWQDQLHLTQQRDLLRADSVKEGANQVELTGIEQKIAQMRREGATAESIAQYEKLLRTIEADGILGRQNLELAQQDRLDQVAAEERRLAVRQREHEAEWQRQLQRIAQQSEAENARRKAEHDVLTAQQQHAAELARIDIARLETIGKQSDTGKVALADPANAAVGGRQF